MSQVYGDAIIDRTCGCCGGALEGDITYNDGEGMYYCRPCCEEKKKRFFSAAQRPADVFVERFGFPLFPPGT